MNILKNQELPELEENEHHLQTLILNLKTQITQGEKNLYNAKHSCFCLKVYKYNCSCICFICGDGKGYWCKNSPKKYCEYEKSDDMHEFCIYCGEPEKRK